MKLLISDVIMSFMWVWSSVLIKIFVHRILGFSHHDISGEVFRYSLSVVNMFFFAYLAKLTNGGAYNPLTVLSSAISGNFTKFLFIVGSRIPFQVSQYLLYIYIKFCFLLYSRVIYEVCSIIPFQVIYFAFFLSNF